MAGLLDWPWFLIFVLVCSIFSPHLPKFLSHGLKFAFWNPSLIFFLILWISKSSVSALWIFLSCFFFHRCDMLFIRKYWWWVYFYLIFQCWDSNPEPYIWSQCCATDRLRFQPQWQFPSNCTSFLYSTSFWRRVTLLHVCLSNCTRLFELPTIRRESLKLWLPVLGTQMEHLTWAFLATAFQLESPWYQPRWVFLFDQKPY